ncbi:Domain of uncharacterised function (DUF3846) [Mycobacteroides abscessus subsp. massiliense]|nr:Domain of uncharacterised function (DUF3846) [Mycobacteroides abscessus subsp. massiliense]
MAERIKALLIRPDETYELIHVCSDGSALHKLVADPVDSVNTTTATLWRARPSKIHRPPMNKMATYLLWKVDPSTEAAETIYGTCLVTGRADEFGNSEPVPDDIVDLYAAIDQINRDAS